VFFFWSAVQGGWRSGLVSLLAYSAFAVLLVGTFNISPGLTPFVVIPACVIPIVVIYRKEKRREHSAEDRPEGR
jgi:hypothetical protein